MTLTPSSPSCVHHWVLTAPRGDGTTGVCKLCGQEREFMGTADRPPAWQIQGRRARAEKPTDG